MFHRLRCRLIIPTLATVALVLPAPGGVPPCAQETPPPPTAPPSSAERVDGYSRALSLYRGGRFAEAQAILEQAIRSGQAARGYRELLGWCYVRQQRHSEGAAAFREAMKENPASADARLGLALALAGTGEAEEVLDTALPLLERDPGNADAEAVITRALAMAARARDRRLNDAVPPERTFTVAKAGADYLEVRFDDRFVPIFVKGVNLGVALPGKFPAEFPEEVATYRGWLDQIAGMGANAVRLYTLLPPAFYQALHDHNMSILASVKNRPGSSQGGEAPPGGFLWLLQGVWTELPDNDHYDDPAFEGGFRSEMERIVDVLHGNIAVARRPGHAFGLYRHDVSKMTLAFILGREWEPFSAQAFDAAHPGGRFEGRYFVVRDGTAMEAWLASQMDHVVAYEAHRYGEIRPVAFTNWPTLDPLHHPTEATKAEEAEITRRLGLPFEAAAVREYDNDAVGIDTNRIRPTGEAGASRFASYHAYPYYPDFMNVDPGYLKARDPLGPDNYIGYLRDLKEHHAGMPVLIAEVGVPTSRGVAHIQPQGFNHGGHNEIGQGEIDARLMENIHETRCAGGVIFAWLDEWFKRNWLVMDFELPADRNPKWLNALDPEQNYGLLAARPGQGCEKITLDGRGEDWAGSALLAEAAPDPVGASGGGVPRLLSLRAAHDEAYLYLRLDVGSLDATGDGEPEWDRARFFIGIDTYGEKEGDHRFPGGAVETPTGMEFMVDLAGPASSRILVDAPYDILAHRYSRPYRSVPNDDGRYIAILVETNRRRIGRDGTVYPEIIHDRSPLRFGTTDPNAPGYDDLADWIVGARTGIIEIRLPWGLLNVTDPSSRRVVADPPEFKDEVGTRVTEGFRVYAAAVDPRDGALLGTLPPHDGTGRIPATPSTLYAWAGWEDPTFHTRLKRSYFILKDRLAAIPDVVAR